MSEAGQRVRLCLDVPKGLYDRLKRRAEQQGLSLTEYVLILLTKDE